MQPKSGLRTLADSVLASAERASRFSEQHVISVLDWGTTEDRPYVVTAAQGQAFQSLFQTEMMPEDFAIQCMYKIAGALEYLHDLGFVYQLLDSRSIVIGRNAKSALLGWPMFCVRIGASGLVRDGNRVFNRATGAPEALYGKASTIEPGVDIYGLGMTFIGLMIGEPRFLAMRKKGLFARPMLEDVPITRPFASLLERMAHVTPSERPTATQVRTELSRIAGGLGIPLEA